MGEGSRKSGRQKMWALRLAPVGRPPSEAPGAVALGRRAARPDVLQSSLLPSFLSIPLGAWSRERTGSKQPVGRGCLWPAAWERDTQF